MRAAARPRGFVAVALAAAALACARSEGHAEIAPAGGPLAAPASVVAVGDLLFEPGRAGPDGLRGFGGVHGVWLGEGHLAGAGATCRQAHELRVGGTEFPWAQWCTLDGRLVAVRAWNTPWGRSIDVATLQGVLEPRLGPSTVRGSGATWTRRWAGDEVVVTLRQIEGARVEIEAALTPSAASRPFESPFAHGVADLGTRPSVLLRRDEATARAWSGFVAREVAAPRVGCRLEPLPDGPLKARFWYGVFEPPIWVPVIYGTAWIPWRQDADGGVLILEGYEPVEVTWGDPGAREWIWCDDGFVAVFPKPP